MSRGQTEGDEDAPPVDRLVPAGSGGPTGTAATSPPSGLRHGMRAFRYRNFRIFFFGALASNSGNWLQNLTVPYVLFELTERSLWVGLAGFAQFFPVFLLGPVGGSLADRYDRRHVLLASQGLMAVAALLLWGVWVLGWHDPRLVLAITALTGVFSGLMIPSWQAFVPSLIPKADLSSAITLNSTQFNASRAVGPALAGLLLAVAGPGWAFMLNVVSFLAVIGAVWWIRPIDPTAGRPSRGPEGLIDGYRSALGYMRRRTAILVGVACAVLVAFFGNPVTQFTVVFADQVYGAGPKVLGLLAAAIGTGAVMIAPVLSSWDARISRSDIVRVGLPLYGLSVAGFGLSPVWPVGLLCLLGVGAGFLAVVATTNTALQLTVVDSMRGRVLATRVMGFTLAYPMGTLLQGALADIIGPQATVIGAGLTLVLIAVAMASRPGLLATLDQEHDHPDRGPGEDAEPTP